jgi:hypothetical protein
MNFYHQSPRATRVCARLLSSFFVLLFCAWAPGAGAVSFSSNGNCVDATYVVPAGITKLHVAAVGAQGGQGSSDIGGTHHGAGGAGGLGSRVVASINVTAGQTLYVSVADNYVPFAIQNSGFGGGPGGSTEGGPVNIGNGGGSASYISTTDPTVGGGCAPATSSLLVVAAGGGGGGGASSFANGGAGGTETTNGGHGGDGGANHQDDGAGGFGATLTGPGGGGAGGHNSSCFIGVAGATGGALQGGYGGDGGSSTGGNAGCQGANSASGSGGGAGAGYYGGGGGGGGDDNSTTGAAAGGGGGAGSSYLSAAGTLDTPIGPACSSLCRNVDPAVITITPFDTAPLYTGGSAYTFTEGVPVNLTLTASGYPIPQIGVNNLPGNVFQQDHHDGTVTLTGTPTNAGGVINTTVIMRNTDAAGVLHTVTAPVMFTTNAPPKFVNPSLSFNGFSVGAQQHFDVGCYAAYPPPTLTTPDPLPAGVTLVDNHDCTGSFTGTPTVGGIFNVVLHANNHVGTEITQQIQLTVLPIPVTVTVLSSSNPSVPGQSVTFSAQITPAPNNMPYVRFDVDGTQLAFVNANAQGLATAPAVANLGAGFHTITATSDAGQYAAGTGTLSQHVNVVSGSASGTTLAATPETNGVYFASGSVYNRTFGNMNTGIDAGGGSGLAIDSVGNIYSFANVSGDAQVRKTAPNGSHQDLGPQLTHGAYGLGVDGAGNIFAAEGDRITRILTNGSSGLILNNGNWSIAALTADSAGNVFFINFNSSSDDVYEIFYPYTAAPVKIAGGLNQAFGVAVDAADNLYVTEHGTSKVYKIPLSTGVRSTLVTGIAAGGVAIDAAGTLYLGVGSTLYQIAPPYTGTPLQIDSGHTVSGIATLQNSSAALGQTVTLNATTISSPAGSYPSGTITFKEGTTILGTAALNASGLATISNATLPIGTHVITASYAGAGAFPASSSTLSIVITRLPVPVTVNATRVHGSGAVNFNYVVGTLPSGITGVTGTLSGCTSSTSPGTSIGAYAGTIFGCTGLAPTGPSASSYAVNYIDGGVTITAQTLPINVVGRSVVNSGVVNFTWSTPITLPNGTTIAGALSGCHSSIASNAVIATYNGTISGCTGLSLTGPAAADYVLTYVDAGVNVVPPSIAVTVTATKPFGGGVSPTFSYTVPGNLPSGVTTVTGTLINCTSSVTPTTAVGTYSNKINLNSCSGLAAQGPNGPSYTITFVDGGVTVTPRGVNVQVSGSQLPGGTPVFRFSVAGGFPADIQFFGGKVSGCTSNVTAGAAPGFYGPPTYNITGCGGLSVFTNDSVNYAITYVDNGLTVGPGNTSTAISAMPVVDPDLFIASRQYRHAILQTPPYTQSTIVTLGGISTATGTAFDSQGNLLATDFSNLYIFDPSGNLRRTVSMGSMILGSIAVDSHDNVFGVVTYGNSSAAIWRLDFPYTGVLKLVSPGFGAVSSLAFDSSDRLFIGDQNASFTSYLESPYTGAAVVIVQPMQAFGGFAVDSSENLYAGISGNGPGTSSHTNRYAPPYSGTPLNFSGDFASSNTGASILVADRQGNLFGTDSAGLFKLPAAGGTRTQLNNNYEFNSAIAIAQSSPPAMIAIGASVPVTVTVGSLAGGTPSGTARVFEGATQLASGALGAGGKVTVTIAGLTEGTHFLTASYLGATGTYNASSSNKQRVVVGRASPTILFTNAPVLGFGASVTVTAMATSALPVTFSTSSPACSVTSAGVVTGTALGACVITANAAGNATYLPALPTTITLTVVKEAQTITFGAAPTIVVDGAGSVTATATSALPVTFSSTNSTCSVTQAGVVTGLSVGACVVTATQPGNANYNAASNATQTVNIGQGAQSIAFDPLPTVTVGSTGIVTATGGATFNPVTFSSSSPTCTVTSAGAVSGVQTGGCVINATQAGSTNYAAASNLTTLTIGIGTQVIGFGAPGSVSVGGSVTVTATASSGLAVTFSSASATCSVTSVGAVSGLHSGLCVIDAAQPGNVNYLPAAPVSQTLSIGASSQAINFGSAPTVQVNASGSVTATGGASNNAVTFSTNSTTCTVNSTGMVTGVNAGPCVIDAAQAGNADYLAAPSVTQTLTIGKANQLITFGIAPSVGVSGTGAVTATATSGLAVSFSSTSTACFVSPTGAVTGIALGSCSISADQSGNTNYLPAATATQLLNINQWDLSISIQDGTNGKNFFRGGALADFTITVQNVGATDAHGASVVNMLPPNLLGAAWTCQATGSATCTASGTQNINDTVNIPAGASVVYHLTATVQSLPELPVINTATVTTASNELDAVPGNNTSTTFDAVGVFADGFESASGGRPMEISVAADKAQTQVVALDAVYETPILQPTVIAQIQDKASKRMAAVHLRQRQGQIEVRLSWRGDNGLWQPGVWHAATDTAHLMLVWSTDAGSSNGWPLAEVEIAQGTMIIAQTGIDQ